MTSFDMLAQVKKLEDSAAFHRSVAEEAAYFDEQDMWYNQCTLALRYERAAEWLRRKADKLGLEELIDSQYEALENRLMFS